MTKPILGLRKEDKNIWERRVAVTPDKIDDLLKVHGIRTVVQPFEHRAYSDEEFQLKGAVLNRDLNECSVILGIKEVPIPVLLPDRTYIFFSHTIKGQRSNMPLLKAVLDRNITLIDYEKITDRTGRRLVFFGNYAGLAGMVDTLHNLGQRLKNTGIMTPFTDIKPAYEYQDLSDAKAGIETVSEMIGKEGVGDCIAPLVFGFSGYGNVSKGAQSIFDLLPHTELTPDELPSVVNRPPGLYKVVFREADMVESVHGDPFDLDIYYNSPSEYRSRFSSHLPYLDVLVNAIYWEEQYPRLVEKSWLRSQKELRLKLICDISCDVNGSIEITEKTTESDNPVFIYDPADDSVTDGLKGSGIAVIAVDNLPTELPRDSSLTFSDSLIPWIPDICKADYTRDFGDLDLPDEVKKAVITHKGRLTPKFSYLETPLGKYGGSPKI